MRADGRSVWDPNADRRADEDADNVFRERRWVLGGVLRGIRAVVPDTDGVSVEEIGSEWGEYKEGRGMRVPGPFPPLFRVCGVQ